MCVSHCLTVRFPYREIIPVQQNWKAMLLHVFSHVIQLFTICFRCVARDYLYIFGGHHGYEDDARYVEGNNNCLYR